MNEFYAIGMDVGGTKMAAGLIAFPEARVMARRLAPTQSSRGGRAVLDEALRVARELADEAAALGVRVAGVGLGVCELVDRDGRIASANCIHWMDEPVREQLSTIAPAVIEADVRAAALAETLFGAARPFRVVLYVTVGTGISCCLMLDGKPYLGARGATGTMASSPISFECDHCGRFNARTLEQIASGPALVDRFNASNDNNAASAREVLGAAISGNNIALSTINSAADSLGSQIALLVNVLDPETVVIGGGLGLSEGPFWERFVSSTRRHIWSDANRDLPIDRASTGCDAGWIGAAASAWRALQAC